VLTISLDLSFGPTFSARLVFSTAVPPVWDLLLHQPRRATQLCHGVYGRITNQDNVIVGNN
jgi:hypothetical protein